MAKMREGSCRTTKTGRQFCKIGGKVRFTKGVGSSSKRSVAGVGSMDAVDSLMGLGDPVGVSFGELRSVLSGAKNCITVVKPSGIQTICKTTGTGTKKATKRRKS